MSMVRPKARPTDNKSVQTSWGRRPQSQEDQKQVLLDNITALFEPNELRALGLGHEPSPQTSNGSDGALKPDSDDENELVTPEPAQKPEAVTTGSKHRKRAPLAPTAIERRYRENLNLHFGRLHKAVPGLEGVKPSKCEILNGAVEHVGVIERENGALRAEAEELRGRIEDLQRWYSASLEVTSESGDMGERAARSMLHSVDTSRREGCMPQRSDTAKGEFVITDDCIDKLHLEVASARESVSPDAHALEVTQVSTLGCSELMAPLHELGATESNYAGARVDLERLRSGIAAPCGDSESGSESCRHGSEARSDTVSLPQAHGERDTVEPTSGSQEMGGDCGSDPSARQLEADSRKVLNLKPVSSTERDKVDGLYADSNEDDTDDESKFGSTLEMRPKASVLADRMPSNITATPSASHTTVSIFTEAREDLKRLQADIGDLSDGSDSSPETSASDSDTLCSPEQLNDHTTNNVNEETVSDTGKETGLRTNTGETTSPSSGASTHKRPQLDDTNEDHARAEITVDRKRTKLSNLRFICCFHNGPGRKCSGTDETISEVLKKLSEQHDTHVCDRCWVLKVKDESSGLPVHPHGSETCLDYCLSPQCHGFTPTIGYRHRFDKSICKTKTSRVRPGDGEAVYRFIFRLVHREFDLPASVWTTEHSLHLDAVPRQGRRKPNKEELTARANDLEKRLEAGERQNAVNADRMKQLEQALADAHRATIAAEEKNAALEKQNRRIVAMLSDALRTGLFLDKLERQSLLRRVEEDAPGALVHQSQSLLTPSASVQSEISSATPARGDVAGQDLVSRPATYEGFTPLPPLKAMPRDHAMHALNGKMPTNVFPDDLRYQNLLMRVLQDAPECV